MRSGEEPRRGRPATVVVASANPFYRRRLARAIAAHPHLRPVGEASDRSSAASLISGKHPDVVLLDLPMAGLDGVGICEWISSRRPQWRTRVVLLGSRPDPALAGLLAAAGAAGYIPKFLPHRRICDAITRVAHGGTAFVPAVLIGVA